MPDWPVIAQLDEQALERELLGSPGGPAAFAPPDYGQIHVECLRQDGFDLGCRFQLNHGRPVRSSTKLGFFVCADGAAIFGSLDQFGVGTNTKSKRASFMRNIPK